MPKITAQTTAFSTPWFDVSARHVDGDESPYYILEPFDYVQILASDTEGRFLLVKQYRPAIDAYTLELPAGLVDQDEDAETCIRRELIEETGYQAADVELLGVLIPDCGRMDNRQWCFAATGVTRVGDADVGHELEVIRCTAADLLAMIQDSRLNHALNLATLMLATLKGRIAL